MHPILHFPAMHACISHHACVPFHTPATILLYAAGTTSLHDLFVALPGGWDPCHNKCEGQEWYKASQAHNQTLFMSHRAFMDNGDKADYKWLADTFPTARFVANVRPMRDWVLSRFDMVMQIRTFVGCTPIGSVASCPVGQYNAASAPTHWTGNTNADVYSWIVDLAKKQNEQEDYFSAMPHRHNRYVQVTFSSAIRDCPRMNAGRRFGMRA